MKRIFMAAVCLPLPLLAQNEEVHPYTKANISPVGFSYEDAAEDGCWTNAGEAAGIARAALEKQGIAFTDGDDAKTVLHLFIDAERSGGGCYGNSRLDLRGEVEWEGQPIMVVLRESGANFIGQANLDGVVPLLVDHMVGTDLGAFPDE
ncbi:hypothetical protein [Maritimibacter dapengensis]|uniref:Uncharacterized protein n=1 Tax=Maritimibacter dapengensis TaxID=2836868 RepID=A0ABS6T0G3_9RHOB|nr:hypothetical protein [Maritimibacter dapengensis]MBV7378728.1 hypothetical protein [Maritimibacter dapengensis]